jgi:mycothiol synthase
MASVEVHTELPSGVRSDVIAFVERATDRMGRRPLPDQLWLDLIQGSRPRTIEVIARDHDALVGYAQASPTADGWTLGLVLDADDALDTIGRAMVLAAVEAVASDGGGLVHWWHGHTPGSAAAADIASIGASVGLTHERSLFEMRAALPVPGDAHATPTRAFRLGEDEAAWLEVNNAAFAGHAEQGGWDLATLQQRASEPWFEPEGFRLHERDQRLAGFCWTKINRAQDPTLGEIYVIGVHPDFHGLGLGRGLTLAGLDSMVARGVTTGMLYVDEHNAAAVGLYRSLGFTVHRTDRALAGEIAPSIRSEEP